MEKFDEVTLDLKRGRIWLGSEWRTAQAMLSGSTSLSRTRIANDEIFEVLDDTQNSQLINPKLCSNESDKITLDNKKTFLSLGSDCWRIFRVYRGR